MDKKRIEKFKKLLLARRQELLRSIAQTRRKAAPCSIPTVRMKAIVPTVPSTRNCCFHQTTHRGACWEPLMRSGRIADGTFGQCMVCEEEIGAKRLEALPWTRYCIACQESSEKNR